ncbi:MAG: Eco29kI family restriction endonuclease [Acidobacteriota bacterium]|nr:Eco29kI family restriction endonuclease [Acidobacteriota bacterium]MDE3265841.1 Eco29kI family restriction endonuclease [Acidobacteriota bacterium]
MSEHEPYDPLDYGNLTVNLVRELMDRNPVDLPATERFGGPGVYALFYDGDYEPYAALRSSDAAHPIYVGKAVPPGARKGGRAPDEAAPALFKRIREHTDSLEAAVNLRVMDFRCRYLVVVPLWITMAERFLIEHYQPCWNVCVEGFGLHNPGKGRLQGLCPWWDTLHPGRQWAARLRPRSEVEAKERLRTFTDQYGASRGRP